MFEAVDDHKRVLLRDIAEPSNGAFVDGPFGSNLKSDEYVEAGVRLIQLQNIGEGYWKDDNKKYITDLKFKSLSRHGAIPGDIAIAKMADPVARACIVPFGQEQYVVVADCIRLRVDKARFDPRYIVRAINSHATRREAERKSIGSTRIRINLGTLKTVGCLVPPLRQQQAIAETLDTLDTTIRQTEAIIEKLKQVKQGLLHDLLTRGIDASGELRPVHSQAPHLYKDSPLGWIPREWEVCGVLDIAPADRQCILTGPFGAQLGQADFVAEGVPVLRIGNVQAGFIDWSDVQCVTQAKADRLKRFSVLTGDLLFARQGATTGRNALADDRSNGALINYHIIRVAVDRERCEPVYLHALFNSDQSKGQVDQEKGRGTREGINSKQIASLRFALPPIEEQRMSVARMTALSMSMDAESMLVEKLRLQKSGLMDDLLTGRVRVTPLLA